MNEPNKQMTPEEAKQAAKQAGQKLGFAMAFGMISTLIMVAFFWFIFQMLLK